jgi:enamidase
MEAIRAATQYPAQMLRHEELGTLAVGNIADLLIVEGNPLSDITTTKNIVQVVKNGSIVPRVDLRLPRQIGTVSRSR